MARPQRKESLRAGLRKNAHLDVTADGSHELSVVSIQDLKIDRSYQRDANQRRVDLISRSYDMDLAGVIEISRRETGEMFVFDGWHRCLGAHGAGETEMLAHIHNGLTQQDEAIRFRMINKTRLPIKPLEEFKSGIVGGDDILLDIDMIVRSLGGHVAITVSDKSGIIAIKSLETVYRNAGPDGLRRGLSIIKDAYGSLSSEYAQATTIKGFSAFVERYSEAGVNPDYKRNRLVRRLKEVGAITLAQQASLMYGIHKGSMWLNVARSMVPIYNTGLASNLRLPEFDSRG
jgi:hypothetical protein